METPRCPREGTSWFVAYVRRAKTGSRSDRAESLLWLELLVGLHAWDELSDTEVLDEGLKDWVSVDLDVLDLDLGLLGDEIHLSFSLLL